MKKTQQENSVAQPPPPINTKLTGARSLAIMWPEGKPTRVSGIASSCTKFNFLASGRIYFYPPNLLYVFFFLKKKIVSLYATPTAFF